MTTEYTTLTPLIGLTMASVERRNEKYNGDELHFVATSGQHFKFYHAQDCCEDVHIDDINGDLDNLIGEPIWLAEEATNVPDHPNGESETWTFYKFATIKGFVDVRWYGTSNGYYSESVYFEEVKED